MLLWELKTSAKLDTQSFMVDFSIFVGLFTFPVGSSVAFLMTPFPFHFPSCEFGHDSPSSSSHPCPAESVPMVTPALGGDKGWHLDSPQPNSALWLSPLFTPLAKLGLWLCSVVCQPGGSYGNKGGNLKREENRSTKGWLIWIWTREEGSL